MYENSESIVRQIKIDLITGTSNYVINWFDKLWSEIHIIEMDVFHTNGGEFIYYKKEDGINTAIFFVDMKNNSLWCNSKLYWCCLENMIGHHFYTIRDITEVLIQNSSNGKCIYKKARPYNYSSVIDILLQQKLVDVESDTD